MKQHFVTFLSPGTFVCEETAKPIKDWDIKKAIKMSKSITERYNAKPFAFQFSTRERSAKELDSKVIKTSGFYYLGGKVLTLDEVKQQMPQEKILISNMECNKWNKIIINTNSWKVTQPLMKDDVVLEME